MSKFSALYLSCALLLGSVGAVQLQFAAGQTASPVIVQKCNLDIEIDDIKANVHAEATMAINMQVTNTQPLEVDLTLTDLQYLQAGSFGGIKQTMTQDNLNSYVNVPFHFVFSKNGIQETTGLLDKLEDEEGEDFIGFSSWNLEMILAQAFQLNGKDLVLNQSYPVDFSVFSDEEDPSVGTYIITQIDPNSITGAWDASVIDTDVSAKIQGNVVWNIQNPLIQQRNLTLSAIITDKEDDEVVRANLLLEQSWK